MSQWPVLYPEGETGPCRLTQLFTFTKPEEYDIFKISTLKDLSASATQILQGETIADGNSGDALAKSVLDTSDQKSGKSMVVLVDFEISNAPSRLKGTNADGSITYSFDVPIGGQTPKAVYYIVNLMRVTKENQPALAAALDAYLRGVFNCGKFDPVCHHNVVSREDPEIIVNVQGWLSRQAGREYWTSKTHTDFFPACVKLLAMAGSWEAELK